MPVVHFTPNLQRLVKVPPTRVDGSTVGQALRAVFEARPGLASYILDDQGAVRRHVSVFIDGMQIEDRTTLSDAVAAESEIWVMQALSGG